jgi:sugar/nucleoside kinase (ribokinase family)
MKEKEKRPADLQCKEPPDQALDVLGMGAVAMDMVIRCDDLPGEDGFSFVREETWLPGGSCSNVLVTLTNLGACCGVAAQVGDDLYGQGVRGDLERAGISTRHLLMKPRGTSLHTIVAVAKNGTRSIFANLGDAFLEFPESAATGEMVAATRVFYTDMFMATPALKLARLCREREVPTAFNLECSMTFMESCGVSRGEVEEMISLCRLFCVGREGLRGLTTIADEREAAVYLDDRYRPAAGVVVTLGENGVFWAGGGETLSVPAFTVDAVDTTGAGDAFMGGLIYGRLLQQWDMPSSLTFANACGALKCLQPGPRFKATIEEIEEFMEARQ